MYKFKELDLFSYL